jgi:hypothetical protein
MTRLNLLAFIAVLAMLACSCADSHTPPDLSASVASLRRYADSFAGLSTETVRSKFAGNRVIEEDWKEGGFGGRQLVATFPEYEVRVFFSENKAITTSIQVLSK